MFGRLLTSIVMLPGTVLVAVPGLILWATGGTDAAGRWIGFQAPAFWVAAILGLGGLALAAWTVRLFVSEGRGTPAPWDPPERFVVRGPYRHVRNPMIGAVFLMLTAEALLFDSWPLGVWLAIFYFANALYIPRFEERGLEKRFGVPYRRYLENVPRWFPSPMAYDPQERTPQTDGKPE